MDHASNLGMFLPVSSCHANFLQLESEKEIKMEVF